MHAADPATVALEVYKSPRHDLMYLYLPAVPDQESPAADLSVLPEALLKRFGQPKFALALELGPERKLAAAEASAVLAAVKEQGFYLQMPPVLTAPETPDARNPHEGRS